MAVQVHHREFVPPLADATLRDSDVQQLRTASPKKSGPALLARLHEILAEVDKLPVLDDRSPDELVGYDEDGLPS